MDFRLPELGEGVYEAELVEWKVRAGDEVRPAQSLAEVMTDKASMELPSPFAGTIDALSATPGTQVKVGQVILSYTPAEASAATETGSTAAADAAHESAPASPSEHATTTAAVRTSAQPESHGNGREAGSPRVPAAPSVRRLAASLGIDLSAIRGSGPGGRILLEDLTSGLKSPSRTPSRPAKPERPSARVPIPPDLGIPGSRIAFRGMRRKTAERMVHSVRTIPHYSYVDECDVSDLVRLRESLRETFAQSGVNLTYLPFFVKAVAEALKEFPIINSSLDDEQEEIVLHDRYDIGIATSTPRGLLVPVVRNADKLSLLQVGREIERLSGEARTGQLRTDDLGRSTFSITSIGGIGGLIATPVINHPEVGILCIGRIVKRPVYDATGNLRAADIVYLSFSFDHRVIDGAVGAAFGNAIIRRLQNPAPLLLERGAG